MQVWDTHGLGAFRRLRKLTARELGVLMAKGTDDLCVRLGKADGL